MCETCVTIRSAFTQAGDVDISSELLKAEKEAKELRAQNSTLTRRWQHQREEIKRLNKVSHDSSFCYKCASHQHRVKVFRVFAPCNNSGIIATFMCLFRL